MGAGEFFTRSLLTSAVSLESLGFALNPAAQPPDSQSSVSTSESASLSPALVPAMLDKQGSCRVRVWTQRLIVAGPTPTGVSDEEVIRFVFGTPGFILRPAKEGRFLVKADNQPSEEVELNLNRDGIGLNKEGFPFAEINAEPNTEKDVKGQTRPAIWVRMKNLISGNDFLFKAACDCLKRFRTFRWYDAKPTLTPTPTPKPKPKPTPTPKPTPHPGVPQVPKVRSGADLNPVRYRDDSTPLGEEDIDERSAYKANDESEVPSPDSDGEVIGIEIPFEALERTYAFGNRQLYE